MKRQDEERFFSKVALDGDCWRWTAFLNHGGYGKFRQSGTMAMAHRWSWQFFNGEIPEGLVLDHLCRNRWCVNPWHLDPVPLKVNLQRGVGRAGVLKRECVRGHLIEEDFYLDSGGQRHCRPCRNIISRRSKLNKLQKER